ncbi:hypothetical protein SALB1_3508 [Salinisphaera sp. LB1]|nr:hypothetical protein SALB1_3508 [Salinisphaera sp. LB1]
MPGHDRPAYSAIALSPRRAQSPARHAEAATAVARDAGTMREHGSRGSR